MALFDLAESKKGFLFQAPLAQSEPIKAVIFDLFGTLAQMKRKKLPWTHFFAKVKEDCVSKGRDKFDIKQASRFVQTNDGPSRWVATQAVLSQLPEFEMEELDKLFLALNFEADVQMEAESTELFEDSLEAMMRLKKNGLKLALVSNLATPYAAALELCRIRDIFDVVVFSFAEGAMKGEPDNQQIYERAAERLNLSKAECLFVGDTIEADYDGLVAVGMQAVPLDRRSRRLDPSLSARPTITTLAELVLAE